MVYEKSALGFNEFINQNRTLSVRERQVLLLVNGVRNVDDLEKFFKKEHLTTTLNKLG
jgi:phosphopantetheine adenylyltransferase